jgi:hypothetical protein
MAKPPAMDSGNVAGEQADHAKDVAGRMVDAAADEAREQGLSQERINSAAKDLSRRLERVYEVAKEGVTDRATKVPQ